MIIEVNRRTTVDQSYRVARALGLFNVEDAEVEEFRLKADIPVEAANWTIGAVYGPSGSGKSSIAAALHDHGWVEWHGEEMWDPSKAIIDCIGPQGSFEDATAALASVGLGTVPTWMRPYHVLSNGERFRADLARLLSSEDVTDVYIDEFTSVVDRRVACIGAQAFAKAWRRSARDRVRRAVVLTPHEDVLQWLAPDWVVRTSLRGVTQTTDGLAPVVPDVDRAAYGDPIGEVVS